MAVCVTPRTPRIGNTFLRIRDISHSCRRRAYSFGFRSHDYSLMQLDFETSLLDAVQARAQQSNLAASEASESSPYLQASLTANKSPDDSWPSPEFSRAHLSSAVRLGRRRGKRGSAAQARNSARKDPVNDDQVRQTFRPMQRTALGIVSPDESVISDAFFLHSTSAATPEGSTAPTVAPSSEGGSDGECWETPRGKLVRTNRKSSPSTPSDVATPVNKRVGSSEYLVRELRSTGNSAMARASALARGIRPSAR